VDKNNIPKIEAFVLSADGTSGFLETEVLKLYLRACEKRVFGHNAGVKFDQFLASRAEWTRDKSDGKN
jgi:hypothetical protein